MAELNAAIAHFAPNTTIIPDLSWDGSGSGTSNGAPDGNRTSPRWKMMKEKKFWPNTGSADMSSGSKN
jgi:hypothetical protein